MAKRIVNIKLDGLKRLKKDFPGFINGLIKDVADEVPKNIIKGIRLRRQGINWKNKLPKNEPSTIARKNGSGPMIDKGVLTSVSKWKIKKVKGGYSIAVPPDRQEEVAILAKGVRTKKGRLKKYTIMKLPVNFVPSWVKTMVNKAFKQFVGKYA